MCTFFFKEREEKYISHRHFFLPFLTILFFCWRFVSFRRREEEEEEEEEERECHHGFWGRWGWWSQRRRRIRLAVFISSKKSSWNDDDIRIIIIIIIAIEALRGGRESTSANPVRDGKEEEDGGKEIRVLEMSVRETQNERGEKKNAEV